MTGYSGTPLADKLGLRAGARLMVTGAPAAWLGSVLVVPSGVQVGGSRMRHADVILCFCTTRRRLEEALDRATRALPAAGALWIAWPKRASGVASELTEGTVREAALPRHLVDVKVAALDATWSGLKLVVRTGARSAWAAGQSGLQPRG